ncbi:MAG: bifunctional pyr operon transcriptional regulator/uracil phosphoribosyltransferase PyrR [Candidatus Schekmanbacteria bacterium]|nr:bifunctional pyr operon transcriptional regulator/uracil phosphoribosyltransferase PyrR [Candidatus Schekmanbacteria bacterium]
MTDSRTILTESDIRRAVRRIAHEIAERNRGAEHVALVGIRTRGILLANRLRAELASSESTEVPLGELDITFYRDDLSAIGPCPEVGETVLPFSVSGRTIVVVDDVLFTGRTVRAAMDALMDYGRPARIQLAVLIDRGHRELPIQADYVGLTVATGSDETVNVWLHEEDGRESVELGPRPPMRVPPARKDQ